jgi:hypothetical protein
MDRGKEAVQGGNGSSSRLNEPLYCCAESADPCNEAAHGDSDSVPRFAESL